MQVSEGSVTSIMVMDIKNVWLPLEEVHRFYGTKSGPLKREACHVKRKRSLWTISCGFAHDTVNPYIEAP